MRPWTWFPIFLFWSCPSTKSGNFNFPYRRRLACRVCFQRGCCKCNCIAMVDWQDWIHWCGRRSTCVASILRIIVTVRLSRTNDLAYIAPSAIWAWVPFSTWNPLSSWYWWWCSQVETTGAIICGCLPLVPANIRHLCPKLKSTLTSWGSKTTAISQVHHTEDGIGYPNGPYIELDRINYDTQDTVANHPANRTPSIEGQV